MAGTTTNASKQILLDYLTGRAVLFPAPQPTYLGLAFEIDDVDPTLLNMSEVNTAGYARVAVPWGVPGVNPVITKSTADIQIGPMTVAMSLPAKFAFLTDTQSGTSGTLLYLWSLTEPLQAPANKPIFIAAGAIAIQ